MKAFTNLPQSKKLVEILPIESADMCYRIVAYNPNDTHVYQPYCFSSTLESDIPCWSLAALLDVLPDSIYDNTHEFSQLEFTKKSVAYMHGATDGIKIGALKDNLVDACYEMIIKLHEQNIL
jgi:hypothetical protein